MLRGRAGREYGENMATLRRVAMPVGMTGIAANLGARVAEKFGLLMKTRRRNVR
jgi:hypothetical protein